MADKMKQVEDPNEAMAKLGYSRMEVPPDMDLDDPSSARQAPTGQQFVPVQPQMPTEPQSQPQQPLPLPEQQNADSEPVNASQEQEPVTVQSLQAKLTDLEEKRRSWQSQAEKAKTEKERLETEAALLRQVALQNRALNQFVGQQQQQQQQSQPSNPEPKLSDFIPPDELEDVHVLDPRYQQWQRTRESWLMENTMNRAVAQFAEQQTRQQKQQLAESRARKLAMEFPEFTDPLTGQPDYVKIQDWMNRFDNAGDDAWVMLRRFQDYSSQSTAPSNGKPTAVDPAQIEKAAAAPATLATAPQASAPVEKEIPAAIKNINKVFGGSLSLPPDFDGIN